MSHIPTRRPSTTQRRQRFLQHFWNLFTGSQPRTRIRSQRLGRLESLEERRVLATMYAVDSDNNLATFDSATPGTIASNVAITVYLQASLWWGSILDQPLGSSMVWDWLTMVQRGRDAFTLSIQQQELPPKSALLRGAQRLLTFNLLALTSIQMLTEYGLPTAKVGTSVFTLTRARWCLSIPT